MTAHERGMGENPPRHYLRKKWFLQEAAEIKRRGHQYFDVVFTYKWRKNQERSRGSQRAEGKLGAWDSLELSRNRKKPYWPPLRVGFPPIRIRGVRWDGEIDIRWVATIFFFWFPSFLDDAVGSLSKYRTEPADSFQFVVGYCSSMIWQTGTRCREDFQAVSCWFNSFPHFFVLFRGSCCGYCGYVRCWSRGIFWS